MQMKQFAFNLDNVEALWTALFQKKNGTVTRNGANAVPLFRGCTVIFRALHCNLRSSMVLHMRSAQPFLYCE